MIPVPYGATVVCKFVGMYHKPITTNMIRSCKFLQQLPSQGGAKESIVLSSDTIRVKIGRIEVYKSMEASISTMVRHSALAIVSKTITGLLTRNLLLPEPLVPFS